MMSLSKTNLTLFVAMTLSTGLLTAMDKEPHVVAVQNYLKQSAITVKNISVTEEPDKTTYIQYLSREVAPKSHQTLKLTAQQNNISNFKLLLPKCYEPSSINIRIPQQNEYISIGQHPLSHKEKTIIITDASGDILATARALMSPAKYYRAATILAIQEITENREQIKDHRRDVIVKNLYPMTIYTSYKELVLHDIPYARRIDNNYIITIPTNYVAECYHFIRPNTETLLSIALHEGKACLSLEIVHRRDEFQIKIDLDEDHKNITFEKGLLNSLIIKDGSNQLVLFKKTHASL